ncbi:MAG: hypothetical protein Q9168_003100 [Polycauliona sp. 1 TL-2023]
MIKDNIRRDNELDQLRQDVQVLMSERKERESNWRPTRHGAAIQQALPREPAKKNYRPKKPVGNLIEIYDNQQDRRNPAYQARWDINVKLVAPPGQVLSPEENFRFGRSSSKRKTLQELYRSNRNINQFLPTTLRPDTPELDISQLDVPRFEITRNTSLIVAYKYKAPNAGNTKTRRIDLQSHKEEAELNPTDEEGS